jgi:hypothetical protein
VLSLSVIAFAQAPKTSPKPAAKPTAEPAARPAEQKQTAKGGPAKTAAEPKQEPASQFARNEPQLVKVAIETSRPEVTTDGSYGIFADLENVGSVALTLYPTETVLVIQPEVASNHDCVFSINGFYPTENDKMEKTPQGGSIIIQPKEHYVAFWDVTKVGTGRCSGEEGPAERSLRDRASSEVIELLSFVPGDYAFVVVGKAHLTPTLGGKEESGYHTFTEHIKLHVGLTQLSAVLASAFGGLIGYFVMALRGGEKGEFAKLRKEEEEKKRTRLTRLGVILRSMLSAALVSAVVTVLLSRVSDTQFPVKVSVADFWGALTIGFVAFFTGNKVIDGIVGFATKKGPEAPPEVTPTPTPQTKPPDTKSSPPTALGTLLQDDKGAKTDESIVFKEGKTATSS